MDQALRAPRRAAQALRSTLLSFVFSVFGARGILAAGGDSHRQSCSLPVVFAEAPAHDGECRCDIRGFCFGRRRARDDQLLVRAEHEAHLLNAQAGLVEERNVFVLVERLGSVALALQAREPWIWEAELVRPGGRHLHFDRGAATTRGQGGGQLCVRGSKPFRQTWGWSGRECFRAPSRARVAYI